MKRLKLVRNKHLWKPTKFVKTRSGYKVSQNPQIVGIGSRFIASLQIKAYEMVIREHAKGRLLDLGCGYAPYYDIYKDYIDDNICVDWPYSSHMNSLIDLLADLNDKLPLKSHKFDTILLTDVLEHIIDPKLLITEIARLLRHNGKVIITVPFFYWLHEQPHDYYRYTEYALRKFCDMSNLQIIYLQSYGGVPEILMDIVAKHLAFCHLLSILYLLACKMLLLFPLTQKLSLRTAKFFPLGYCLVAQKAAGHA